MKIKLWKENKLDQEFKMEVNEIAKKYLASPYEKIETFLDQKVSLFIGAKDGLNSVWDVQKQSNENKRKTDISDLMLVCLAVIRLQAKKEVLK